MAKRSPTHLKHLTPDPKNARAHTPRNVGMIADALGEVGAARSIVIDENNVVLAGNATIEAAGERGITKVQTVDADGETIVAVRRKGLTQRQKTRLALFDNRTAELADWDVEVLATMDAEDLSGLFSDVELSRVLDRNDEVSTPQEVSSQFNVLVICPSENDQAALLKRLMDEGLECRALIS